MNSVNIAVVGIIVVFITLILITYLIILYSRILGSKKSSKTASSTPNPDAAHDIGAGAAHDMNANENYINTKTDPKDNGSLKDVPDEELVAAITAAIQAAYASREVKTRIRVLSFRRVSADTPAWKFAAWRDQISQSKH
jgi:Na+-transporting methylmalonyl-CoA/oxaloacetate decarboxylase gamma subunit